MCDNSVHTDSLREYIGKTLLLILVMFLLFILFGTDRDTMNSFLAESVVFFYANMARNKIVFRERKIWVDFRFSLSV